MNIVVPSVAILFAVLTASHANRLQADIVIVGAGTAGSALAGRLCASSPHLQIVLMERGAARSPQAEFLVRAPRLFTLTLGTPEVSETIESEPVQGLNNRSQRCVTGQTLGGSSSLNGMQFSFPLGDTISRWRIAGLNETTARQFSRRAFQKVGFAPSSSASLLSYSDDYLQAAIRSGIPEDHRRFENQIRDSVQKTNLAIDDRGRRVDAYTAYVKPVINGKCKKNLQVITGVTVTRLLLRKRTVEGVEYVSTTDTMQTSKMTLMARKEVIVSAGPYGSPKLLQLSGIGPRAVLKAAGVPLVHELPVGMKPQGRAITSVGSKYTGVPLSPGNNASIVFSEKTRREWKAGRLSALSFPSGPIIGTLKNSGYFSSLIVQPATLSAGLDEPIIKTLCLGNAQSFGSVKIASRDPFAQPKVDLNLLSKFKDVRMLITCSRRALKIHKNFPEEFGVVNDLNERDINESYVRNNAMFGLHFVGGCAVGSVVRRDLRVRGIGGVRVIDSSVLNSIPVSAGPLGSVYMLAEFMADSLKHIYSI